MAHQSILQTCKTDGCEERHYSKGYCGSCYANWRRTGDPLGKQLGIVVRELRALGTPYAEIGKLIGVSRQRAHQYLVRQDEKSGSTLMSQDNRCYFCGKGENAKLDTH